MTADLLIALDLYTLLTASAARPSKKIPAHFRLPEISHALPDWSHKKEILGNGRAGSNSAGFGKTEEHPAVAHFMVVQQTAFRIPIVWSLPEQGGHFLPLHTPTSAMHSSFPLASRCPGPATS